MTVPKAVTIDGIAYKVTTLEKDAFSGCENLQKIVIGKNIEQIRNKAFSDCDSLQVLVIKSTNLKAKKLGQKAFSQIPDGTVIKVPKKKYKEYKKMLRKCGLSKKVKIQKN